MGSKDNPCKSFAPNIFNKNKCQNCFRPRETHLQSDKDLNKAKPVYVGWLLLCPIGTDFTNPMHRNRKWQRRYFILFEHGALRYALDDNMTTVAQGTIDMNRCTDVVYAESMTGQKHSLCIFTPEQKYYVRGENKEDIMGWYDNLVVYPETIKEDMKRKKRLFKTRRSEVPPTDQAPISVVPVATSFSAPNTPLSKTNHQPSPLTKVVQSSSHPMQSTPRSRNSSTSSVGSGLKSPTSSSERSFSNSSSGRLLSKSGSGRSFQPAAQEVVAGEGKASNKLDTSYFTIERKQINNSNTDLSERSDASSRLQRNMSVSTSSLDSTVSTTESTDGSQVSASKKKHLKDYHNLAEVPKAKRISSRQYKEQRKEVERLSRARSPGREEIQRLFGRQRRRSRVIEAFEIPKVNLNNKENNEPVATTTDTSHDDKTPVASPTPSPRVTPKTRGRTISRRPTSTKQGTQTDQGKLSGAALRRAKSLDRKSYDSVSISADLFNVKKGWLTMNTEEDKGKWQKHWFVLNKKLLKYYQDSSSEDITEPEGEINLMNFIEISEMNVQRNYGFCIKTQDMVYNLAAMTSGIRRNWMTAISKATESADKESVVVSSDFKAASHENEKPPSDADASKEDLSAVERSQRRRARIRERRKEGRSRTFDFAELCRLADKVSADDLEVNKVEAKARTRILDTDSLLNDFKKISPEKSPKPLLRARSKAKGVVLDKEEWGLLEKVGKNERPKSKEIAETANMVKALQTEVDSLRKQMEKVDLERSSSVEEQQNIQLDSGQDTIESTTELDNLPSDNASLQAKFMQQNSTLSIMKKELSELQDELRNKGSELRECGMQLDITLNESQLVETQLSNSLSELTLERSKREESEKESKRQLATLTKELDESDAEIKKKETALLDAQRRVRELERQVHLQKDHNKESTMLQDHIERLNENAGKHEAEMATMQENYEIKCQSLKDLEEDIIQAQDLIKRYTKDNAELKEALKISEKSTNKNDENLKLQIKKLLAQSQVDDDRNKSLQVELKKEKETSKKLRLILDEHDKDIDANEKQFNQAMNQLSNKLKEESDRNLELESELKEATNDYTKLTKLLSGSEQTVKELKVRLSSAEKQLGDIEVIKTRKDTGSAGSSFKAKITELEAEMGDTGHMIAARLNALDRSRRDSDSSTTSDKESNSQKILRLENSLDKKSRKLKTLEEKLKEFEEKEDDIEKLSLKIKELRSLQETSSSSYSAQIEELKLSSAHAEEAYLATRSCLEQLHSRASQLESPAPRLVKVVLGNLLKVAAGNEPVWGDGDSPGSRSPGSRSPSPDHSTTRWSRNNDRQRHQKTMSRLRQLTEKLKSADGRLVSPTAFVSDRARPIDLQLPAATVSEESGAVLFAKQISMQTLLLAEMAATLRRSQSTPSLQMSRSQINYNQNNRQSPTSAPQLTSAEFSDSIAHHTTTGGLLQHVDTLAQKLTLEGMLMREISRLKEQWLNNRARSPGLNQHRSGLSPGPNSELGSSMMTHAHISYVLQVYNERISRLSLEAKQSRHRAEAVMRKLKELVEACKTQDLEAVSNLAVQVDTGTIAEPYSNLPLWEQQVDYGTLHGAQSMPASGSNEAMNLDQEASFFQNLSESLKCMDSDVHSLSKIGGKLVATDATLQKYLQPSEIGEHASTIAREAIVQAEIIYISHRLRRDYDEELRKAKSAVSDQANHFKAQRSKFKQDEETAMSKIKQLNNEHQSKVNHLMKETARMEQARAEMSKDVEEKYSRLSRKHEQELALCNSKHEQECVMLRKEINATKSQLQTSTKEYMNEVKGLTQRLEEIKMQHRIECEERRDEYERMFVKAREECNEEVKKAEEEHSLLIEKLKNEHERELNSIEKELERKMQVNEEKGNKEYTALKTRYKEKIKKIDKEHKLAITRAEKKAREAAESLKRDFDELLRQEKSKHSMELKSLSEDSESNAKKEVKRKTKELRKEHDKMLENRERLHAEQLAREKEDWTKQLKQQFEREQNEREKLIVSQHQRTASIASASESESKDALRETISLLEEQIDSMQLEDSHKKHEYQGQVEEIKSLCDQSFQTIEESHAKQLDEITSAHDREFSKLKQDYETNIEIDKLDTRRAIEAMRKVHLEEIKSLQSKLREVEIGESDSNHGDPINSDKLQQQYDSLLEHHSRKCVELAAALEDKEKLDDALLSLQRENSRLVAKNFDLDEKFKNEISKLQESFDSDENCNQPSNLYQVQAMLRVKSSEIDYLKLEVNSLNKQLEECYQEKKHSQQKHQTLFEELTLSRSKEAMARRESNRLKHELRKRQSSNGDDDVADRGGKGYDFQKSRSQPDIPVTPPPSSNKPPTSSVKRRSSDRTSRNEKTR